MSVVVKALFASCPVSLSQKSLYTEPLLKAHCNIRSEEEEEEEEEVGSPVSPRMDTYPGGLVDSWTSNTPPC